MMLSRVMSFVVLPEARTSSHRAGGYLQRHPVQMLTNCCHRQTPADRLVTPSSGHYHTHAIVLGCG